MVIATNRDKLTLERISKLRIVLFLTIGYVFAQIIIGLISHSLSLLADAGHVLTDVGGLALSLIAIKYTTKSATPKRTYGFYIMEILASLINSLVLMLLSTYILYEAYRRIVAPPEVHSFPVIIVATIGIILNFIALRILGGHIGHSHGDNNSVVQQHSHSVHSHNGSEIRNKDNADEVEDNNNLIDEHHPHDIEGSSNNKDKYKKRQTEEEGQENLNIATAKFEVLSDTIGSAVVIASGIVMLTTKFHLADPIASIGLALFILPRTWTFIKKSMHILMEAVPANISYEEVKNAILCIRGVTGIFDMHIWTITSGMNALSAHVVVIDMSKSQAILQEINSLLEKRFKINHATIQIERYHSESDSI